MFRLLFLFKRLLQGNKEQAIFKLTSYNSLKFNLSQKTRLNYFSLILLLSITLYSCNTTEPPIITPPPPDLRKITLTFEDASCTEV